VIVTTRAIKGAEVVVSNSEVETRHPELLPSVNVITFSEREEESADLKNVYWSGGSGV